MGAILEYIDSHNDGGFKCYRTKKTSLDDNNVDAISSENSDFDTVPLDTKGVFAEDDKRRVDVVSVRNLLNINILPPPAI